MRCECAVSSTISLETGQKNSCNGWLLEFLNSAYLHFPEFWVFSTQVRAVQKVVDLLKKDGHQVAVGLVGDGVGGVDGDGVDASH